MDRAAGEHHRRAVGERVIAGHGRRDQTGDQQQCGQPLHATQQITQARFRRGLWTLPAAAFRE